MKQLAIYHDNKTKPSLLIEQLSTLQETIKTYLSSYVEYLEKYNNETANFSINESTKTVEIYKYPINKSSQVQFVSKFKYEYVN